MVRHFISFSALIGLFLPALLGCTDATPLFTDLTNLNEVKTVVIEPVYPSSPNWNDYVLNDGVDRVHSSGAPCSASEPSLVACIHSGELRKINLADEPSCSRLTLAEDLSVFKWFCDDSSGNVIFYSTGLKPLKRLADLITPTGWKDNSVSIYKDGRLSYASEASSWHTNEIVPLPDNSNSALVSFNSSSDSGDIFILESSRESYGYEFSNLERTSLVIFPGATLTYVGGTTPPNNCISGSKKCLIQVNNSKFMWFEGNLSGSLSGAPSDRGIYTNNTSLSQFRHLHVFEHYTNIDLFSSHGNKFRFVSAIRSIDPATSRGIHLRTSSSNNIIMDSRVKNNGDRGLEMESNSGSNILLNIQAANNGNIGIYNISGSYHILKNVTSASNNGAGFWDVNTTDLRVINYVSANNIGDGFTLNTSSTGLHQYHNIVAVNNSSAGVQFGFGTNNFAFSGSLIFNGNLGNNCKYNSSYPPGSSPGLENSTCTSSGADGSNSYSINNPQSSATLRTELNLNSSFVGAISSGDLVNGSNDPDNDGIVSFSDITDWLFFESFFRNFGKTAASIMNSSNRGECLSNNCQIWDWRLKLSDTTLRNNTIEGATGNPDFTAGATCPSVVNGDVVTTPVAMEIIGDGIGDNDGTCEAGERCYPSNTFLLNAHEIIGDLYGNDNGLCESEEACIYNPNFGAYQGHGQVSNNECNFQDGNGSSPVVGVRMYANPINGL